MREYGLKGRVSRIYANNAGLHKFYKKVPNLRLGKAKPQGMNEVWVVRGGLLFELHPGDFVPSLDDGAPFQVVPERFVNQQE